MNRFFVTARFWLVAGIGGVAAALTGFAGVPVAAALGGWAAVCAGLVAADALLASDPARVGVARRVPARSLRDEPVQVLVDLQNLAPRALRGAVYDTWPGHANAQPSEHQRSQIARTGGSATSKWVPVAAAPGERVRVSLTLTPKRKGAIRSNFVAVRSRGPLGLAGRTTWHEIPGEIAVAWSPRGMLRNIIATPQRETGPAAPILAVIDDRNRDTVLREFEELQLLAAHYSGRSTPQQGNPGPLASAIREHLPQLTGGAHADNSGRLLPLIDHLSDLFARATQLATDQQQRLLLSRYADTLSKLNALVAEDYYGDILRNPHYWSDPEQRIEQVLGAVAAVDNEVVENIRQLSESRDIEFQVRVESLTRPRRETGLSDLYTDLQPRSGRDLEP